MIFFNIEQVFEISMLWSESIFAPGLLMFHVVCALMLLKYVVQLLSVLIS